MGAFDTFFEGVERPLHETDPKESARRARHEIQKSAWALLKGVEALNNAQSMSHYRVASSVFSGKSFNQAMGDRLQVLTALDNNVLESAIDFRATLYVLVPLDPVFRGIEHADNPMNRFIERAREWITPVIQDAVQLDRDLIS